MVPREDEYQVRVHPDATAIAVKHHVMESLPEQGKLEAPLSHDCKLVFGGNDLNDGDTMTELAVEEGRQIKVRFKARILTSKTSTHI